MSAKPLGIIELLTRIGEDNVTLQNLVECATNFQSRGKRGRETAITFLTNQMTPTEVFHHRTAKIGLVLWLPADLVDAAREAHRKENGEHQS